jgi:hypothetical protein
MQPRMQAPASLLLTPNLCCPTQEVLTKEYASLLPSLADLARNLVRDLDPQVRLRWRGAQRGD